MRILSQTGFEVVGQGGTAPNSLTSSRNIILNCASSTFGCRQPTRNEGLEAARAIRGRFPDVAIVILSAHVHVEPAAEFLASGGKSGYLLKRRVGDLDEFVRTLREIVGGANIIDPSLVEELIEMKRLDDPLDALTPRERDVLVAMAEGRSNAGIAQSLFISEGTLEKHIHSIFMKLRLPDTELDHRRVLAVIKYLRSR